MKPFNRGRGSRREELERIERRLAHLEDQTGKILDHLRARARSEKSPAAKPEHGKLKRVEQGIESLLRAQYLAGEDELPYPQRLMVQRFRLRSQNLEDGLTLALLREAGIKTRRFVELGCGDTGGNSGFLADELAFAGLMVDGSPERLAVTVRAFPQERVRVVEAWVTREGVNALIAEHGFAGEVDLLSIDLDGNDYWIWEAIDACSPRVVIVEYNSSFGAERAVIVPYDDEYRRIAPPEDLQRRYYGASLAALDRLADHKGYRLVAVEPRGTNAYFLRDDVAPHVPRSAPGEVYRMLNKDANLEIGLDFDVYGAIADNGLELIDLDAAAST